MMFRYGTVTRSIIARNVYLLVSRGGVIGSCSTCGLLLLCMQLDEQEEKESNREKVQGDMVCLLMNVLLGCFAWTTCTMMGDCGSRDYVVRLLPSRMS